MASSLPQRVLLRLGDSSVAEQAARALDRLYAPLLPWSRRTPLYSPVLGHSLHPPLTDVTVGYWLSASLVDAFGDAASRRTGLLLTATGLVAAVPTAIAGAADWSQTSGADRRIGAVHAVGMDVAVLLATASVLARVRGDDRAGVRLAWAANIVVAAAGFLGGHLALSRGLAARN